jgi:hypothetical protein
MWVDYYFLFMLSLFVKKEYTSVLPYWNNKFTFRSNDANLDSVYFNNFKTINNGKELV